jgi:hypothetical protein
MECIAEKIAACGFANRTPFALAKPQAAKFYWKNSSFGKQKQSGVFTPLCLSRDELWMPR